MGARARAQAMSTGHRRLLAQDTAWRRVLLAALDDLRARRICRAVGWAPCAVWLGELVAGDRERSTLFGDAEAVVLALGLPHVILGAGLLHANVGQVRLGSAHAHDGSAGRQASRAGALAC